MTERNCGNCRHFVRIESAATGHCTNPLVVSHQGQLVMYRAGEIGCRRGWKQDLWEASEDPVAATPAVDAPLDYGRAAAWADSRPSRPDSLNDILQSETMDDNELLDPRRVRDSREAMRRARELKKREQLTTSTRDPFDQPILGHEQAPGTDSVLHVQAAPEDRVAQPIVPPVSVDEVRRRVDEMRRPRHYNDPPPSIHFDRYDDHFSDRTDLPIIPDVPGDSRLRADLHMTHPEPSRAPIEAASEALDESGYTGYDDAEPVASPEFTPAYEFDADEEIAWPDQAPWGDEDYAEWQEQRPKRRSWFSNWLHRPARPRPVDPRESMFTWEPELEEIDDHQEEPGLAAADTGYAEPYDRPVPEDRYIEPAPAGDRLPPLPFADERVQQDDYLLADGRFADADEEDPAARQIEHVCATCRYFRPDGTCGNAFAFTYRRRVSEEYLSCASSIGAWWLPSDHYWESVVSFTHHGQPTPLLDRYQIQADAPDSDEEVRTP